MQIIDKYLKHSSLQDFYFVMTNEISSLLTSPLIEQN